MTDKALKACPFCGGDVHRCGTKPDDIHDCHHIVCPSCGTFDLGCAADPNNAIEGLDELNQMIAAAWNRRAPEVPEGWKLVPVDPDAMQVARGEFDFHDEDHYPNGVDVRECQVIDIYRAMIAAAPQPPKDTE